MRWPFVSRSDYDIAMDSIEVFKVRAAEFRVQAELADRHYDDLLDKYHALKVSGATPPQPPPQPVQVDPVIAAINDASNRDPKLRALMSREAQRLRLAGFDDHEIIQQIQDGVTPEGLPA